MVRLARALRRFFALALPLAVLLGAAAGAHAQVWEVGNLRLLQDGVAAGAAFGTAITIGDLSGDGRLDVAVGAPEWSLQQGQVTVFRGTAPGRALETWWSLNPGGTGEFGAALAAGDFDGDGFDELAVGSPNATVTYNGADVATAGAVTVWKYIPTCTCWDLDETISQADTTSFASPEAGDAFGSVLVAGDFNGDGRDDLAVGTPAEAIGATSAAGVVQVFYGSDSMLAKSGSLGIRAGTGGVSGTAGSGDLMGIALAVGDFDGDAFPDLAIGAPGRAVGGISAAGQVHILRGTAGGLTTVGQQLVSESSLGATVAAQDRFGAALAAGNFDEAGLSCVIGDCYVDLAVGVPGKTVQSVSAAGEVLVLDGGSGGIQATGWTALTQSGNGGALETNDRFGSVLAAGFLHRGPGGFLGGTVSDLAVGVPYEDFGSGLTNNGYVHLFFGALGGINTDQPVQAFGESAGFRIAPAGDDDIWSSALAIADIDADGQGDLVIAAPGKRISGLADAGAVAVLYGALFADGFDSSSVSHWAQHVP